MAQERSKGARTSAPGGHQPADRDDRTKKALERFLVILAIRLLRKRRQRCRPTNRAE